jgi:hypothetical protein
MIPGAVLRCLALTALIAVPGAAPSQPLLDDFETLAGWEPIHSHGDASRIAIAGDRGKTGNALRIDFSFIGFMGSVSIQKRFDRPLPPNYRLSFDLRGEAPVNNLVVRLKDSLDNVWWVNRTNFAFPRSWMTVGFKKHQIQYGWGPSLGGDLRRLDRIEIMIDVVQGGKGTVWLDNLRVEPVEETDARPAVSASSTRGAEGPAVSSDGRSVGPWHSADHPDVQWLTADFGGPHSLGGLVIDWDREDYAREFDVALSGNGRDWSTAHTVSGAMGKRSFIPLADGEGRYFRLTLRRSSRGRGYGITALEFKGPEFSFSPNEFLASVAAYSPRGYFPKYFSNQQSYWTLAGVPHDEKEALINEQGMIETDKLSFSLDPFLYVNGRLITWNDVALAQSLEKEYIPIPSVRWTRPGIPDLTITALASGPGGNSILHVRYELVNTTAARIAGKFFIAVRPFQVNPPWQTFTIVGGVSRIDSMTCGDVIRVNDRALIPLTPPTAAGTAAFDQGDVTCYLSEGSVPPFARIVDPSGSASGALQYDFDLAPGERREILAVVPFYPNAFVPFSPMSPERAHSSFESAKTAMTAFWEQRLNQVTIALPASAPPIFNTIRSNLAYVLINADGVATQPGSRSYERSWLRDGSLTSVAFLEMGITQEVRAYIDWYAGYQYPDGKIPAVVERRGPEPTPENDSHGQFIYAALQYFRFTQDTAWLRGKWDNIAKTVKYLQSLRALRKTDAYRNGTAEQRACFGLVPESISHEGYSWKPQHSYWDDFFVIRGLKDAVSIAGILGHKEEEREYAAERDDFRTDFYASMRMAMDMKHVPFIPGCVELGDFSGLSTTIGITPCDELGWIPEPALTYTFDESYRQFLGRKNNTVPWDAYLPYDARFVGAYVFLGQRDRAYDILSYLMGGRRPPAWNHWAEVVWKDRDAPKSIGDMPHSWAASDFIRAVRTMFVYERERDDALVVGAGIPPVWLEDPGGVSVRGLPTFYGRLDMTMRKEGGVLITELSGEMTMPPGFILLKPPLAGTPLSVIGGRALPGTEGVVVDRLPASVRITY